MRGSDVGGVGIWAVRKATLGAAAALLCCVTVAGVMEAQMAAPELAEHSYGPYNGRFLFGGRGFEKPLPPELAMLRAETPWTMSMWFEAAEGAPGSMLLGGIGDPAAESSRMLALVDGRPALRFGVGNQMVATAGLAKVGWHHLVATFDGQREHLFADGVEVATGELTVARAMPQVVLGPATISGTPGRAIPGYSHFGGLIAGFELTPGASTAKEVRARFAQRPDFLLVQYTEGSPAWPTQTKGTSGYFEPQDPSLMPRSRAPISKPVAKPVGPARESLESRGESRWAVAANWRLAAAPGVQGGAGAISQAGFNTTGWMAATVPGTVLTTMIDRGVYPDSDFGLNNLAIPETLNKQDYWYRVEFPTPKDASKRRMGLTFHGINYAADVWMNGKELGRVKGAFIRGTFDVSGMLRETGPNVLAVRISPPPHPGVPHEQSIKGGAGDNGGQLCLDGPTFVATEGWDWIPGIRDRNSGIWQDVVLSATDAVKIGDPKVVTRLPLPDISSADVTIDVPVRNAGETAVMSTLTATFEGVTVLKQVQLAPGESVVRLTPAEFPQMHVAQPRLWWPNGYGRPDLYHLKLQVGAGGGVEVSDHRELTFGIREVTYELALFEPSGHLRRVEVDPTLAMERGEQVVDVTHAGMRPTAEGFAATLTAAGLTSPASRPVTNEPEMNDLVLKVNGVRIAARGGNWGMDDSRKRVSREHLEPFFRLHQVANLNIIRNWVGQNTEETFFQLADEYGMMVWNDFWASTQGWNVEPEDPQLFLDNARDVVKRFRNHPSIVVWCGRNEGVPQPVLNEGLIKTFAELDGTRYYSPSSNRVNLRDSGPYKYEDPARYYAINRGFSVELGISSMSTIESFRASVAEADQWPISDAWAYHDWHHGGNGDVAPLMGKIEEQFGAATSLEEFERKVQMFNYVDHRAIFEGFNQHLWAPNSGRMLWMTQPAWPSNMWQILSSDYDTQASFYAVKKACEPQHVQMDLSDGAIAVINTTRSPMSQATVRARVFSLDNQLLQTREGKVDVVAGGMATPLQLDLQPLMADGKVVLVKLELMDAGGTTVSDNVYWWGASDAAYRAMNALPKTKLEGSASSRRDGEETEVTLRLTNPGKGAVLAVKVTPVNAKTGERMLPAYLSDNYVSLLPGESRTLLIRLPAAAGVPVRVGLRGWNVVEGAVAVSAAR